MGELYCVCSFAISPGWSGFCEKHVQGDVDRSMLTLLNLKLDQVFLAESEAGDEVFCVKQMPNPFMPLSLKFATKLQLVNYDAQTRKCHFEGFVAFLSIFS